MAILVYFVFIWYVVPGKIWQLWLQDARVEDTVKQSYFWADFLLFFSSVFHIYRANGDV
jgi:hypothetical protein